MAIQKETYPPDQLGRATLVKKLFHIAAEGRKAAQADPNYGLGCECQRCSEDANLDPSKEAEKVLFKVGPKGGPYSDVANACEAGNVANEKYAELFDGHFEWHSKVYEEDWGRANRRKLGRAKRGWLLIRFIPTRTQVGWGSGAE